MGGFNANPDPTNTQTANTLDPSGMLSKSSGGPGKKAQAAPPTYASPGSGQGASQYQQAAEGQANQSHVGLNGQFGSSGWSQDPKTGAWTQSQSLNGPLGGAAAGLEGQIANQAPLDYGLQSQQNAANSAYSQATSRLDPQFAQQGEQLQSQLASQGLDPGTDAAKNAQGNFDRAKTDAYQTAQNNAWGQGLAAQQQSFGQSVQAQQAPYQHLQSLAQLLGGAQGVGSAQSPDYLAAMGLQGNFNLGQANQQNQAQGQGYQAIGSGVGALAGMLSDLRAKFDIRELADEALPGVPWVEFQYRHAPGLIHRGVIAQQVLAVRPDLVRERPDGLLEVNYGGLR